MERRSSIPPPANRNSTIPPPPQTIHIERMESIPMEILPTNELAKRCVIFSRIEIINALITNEAGSALPVCISKTKKPKEGKIQSLQFADDEYYSQLSANNEEANEIFTQFLDFLVNGAMVSIDDIRKLDALRSEIIEKESANAIPKELMELKAKYREERDYIAEKIEIAIVNGLTCMKKYETLKMKRDEMAKCGPRANNQCTEETKDLPSKEKDLTNWSQTSINIEDNIGKLAIMFLRTGNRQVRHHAKLKFFKMIQLMTEENRKSASESNKALSVFKDVLFDEVVCHREGEEKNSTIPMCLNTIHNPSDLSVKKFKLSDAEETYGEFTHSKKINCHRGKYTKIVEEENTDGDMEKKEVEVGTCFTFESRKKSLGSKSGKSSRTGKSSDKQRDEYGFRMCFGSIEELEEIEKQIIESFRFRYQSVLVKAQNDALDIGDMKEFQELSKMMERKRQCVLIEGKEKVQTGINNKGEPVYGLVRFGKTDNTDDALKRVAHSLFGDKHDGTSDASSEEFKVKKYLITYRSPYGQKYLYEAQMMLGDGYVDLDFHKKVNTRRYQFCRSIDDKGGALKQHLCNVVYPSVNLKKIKSETENRIEAGNREILAPDRAKATKAKEKAMQTTIKDLNGMKKELEIGLRNLRRKEEEFETRVKAERGATKTTNKKKKKKKKQ